MVTSDWWLGIRVSPWGVPSTDSGKLCSNEKLGIRNEELGMVVRRIKIMKRRGVLIAFRAVVISSASEKSLLQNAHCLL